MGEKCEIKTKLTNSQTSSDGNVTVSEVVFLPAPEDNGKIVTCSVTTETINGGAGLFLKDSRILDVKRKEIYVAFRGMGRR